MQRRTDYEYILRRFELTIGEAEQYLVYEKNLDKLLELRAQKLFVVASEEKELKGQIRTLKTAQIRHIAYIYDRIVSRFSNELQLWDDYIEFLVSKNSNALLDALFGRVIALHPKEVHFWIKAANHELQQNNNMHATRILMQRGLRANERNVMLWQASFELEIHNILRALQRQQKLGITDEELSETIVASAMVVYRFARDSLGADNISVLLSMHITALLSLPRENNHLAQQIENDLKQRFPTNISVWNHVLFVHLRESLLTNAVSTAEQLFSFPTLIAQLTLTGFTEVSNIVESVVDVDSTCSLIAILVQSVSELSLLDHTLSAKALKKAVIALADNLLDLSSEANATSNAGVTIEGLDDMWKTDSGKALKKEIVTAVKSLLAKLNPIETEAASSNNLAKQCQWQNTKLSLFSLLQNLQLGDKALTQTITSTMTSITSSVFNQAMIVSRKCSTMTTVATLTEREAFKEEVQAWAALYLSTHSAVDAFTQEQQQTIARSAEILSPWLIQGTAGDKLLRTMTVNNESMFTTCMLNILKDIVIVSPGQRAEYLVILLSSAVLSEEDRIMITDKEVLRAKYKKLQDTYTSIMHLKQKNPMSFTSVDMSPFFSQAVAEVEGFLELLEVKLESKAVRAEVNFYQQLLEHGMRECAQEKDLYEKYAELLRKMGKHKEASHVQFKRRRLVESS